MESQGIGIRNDKGLRSRCNGVNIHQTRGYIKLSCETYIKQALQTHGWEKPGARESDRHDSVPLSGDFAKSLCELQGPMEGTPEHKELESKVGYSYHQALGEIIYACIICRVDIGHAATFLSRFAQAPAEEHYKALKDVVKPNQGLGCCVLARQASRAHATRASTGCRS